MTAGWIKQLQDHIAYAEKVGDAKGAVKKRQLLARLAAGLPPYDLWPEPSQASPKRPPDPKTAREWRSLLSRAHRHVRGTRQAVDLNPDWTHDLQQFKEAEEFIAKAEQSGYVLSNEQLLEIDADFQQRLRCRPNPHDAHYGSRFGFAHRRAIGVAKKTCRWWLGKYDSETRRRNPYPALFRDLGMTELEGDLTYLRWGRMAPDAVAGVYSGIDCPSCGHDKATRIKTRHMWKCRRCHKQFNTWTGTVFQGTRLKAVNVVKAVRATAKTLDILPSIRDLELCGLSKFQAMRMRRILDSADAFVGSISRWFGGAVVN